MLEIYSIIEYIMCKANIDKGRKYWKKIKI